MLIVLTQEKIGHKHPSFPGLDTQFIWDPTSEEASKHERKYIEGIAHIIRIVRTFSPILC